MRRASNAVLTTRATELDDVDRRGRSTETGAALTRRADSADPPELVLGLKQLVDDLAHDLRQPLTSMTMNLQSALRCLQFVEPRVPSALEALTDCLDIEGELVRLVAALQRHLSEDVAESLWFSLNDLAQDTYESLAAEQAGERRLVRRFAEPPPYVRGVDTWALHKGVLGTVRRLLARESLDGSSRDLRCLIIETRQTSEQAELRLGGIQRVDMPEDIQSILECARAVAELSCGKASIELGPRTAAIVISFPAWTSKRRQEVNRRNHGA